MPGSSLSRLLGALQIPAAPVDPNKIRIGAYSVNPSGNVTPGVTTQATGSTFVVYIVDVYCTLTGVTDNYGNTYTPLGTAQAWVLGGVNWDAQARAFICVNGVGGANHVATATGSFFGPKTELVEVINADTTSPLDVNDFAVVDSTANPILSTSSATSYADELLLAFVGGDYLPSAPLWNNSFLPINFTSDGTFAVAAAYRIVSATGSYQSSYSRTATNPDASVWLISLKQKAGGDVTVALSGAQVTSSAGTLAQSRTLAATGQSVTSSAGTITASTNTDVTVALTGAAVTASAGSVGSSRSTSVSGQAASATAGNLAAGVSRALSGQASASSAGSISPSSSRALAGQAATASAGSISTGKTVGVTGAQIAASAGSILTGIAIQPSQTTVTASAGTIVASAGQNITVALVGSLVSSSTGTLSTARSIVIAGQQSTAQAGVIAHARSSVLTGSQASSAAGVVTIAIATGLTGAEFYTEAGVIVATDVNYGDVTVDDQRFLVRMPRREFVASTVPQLVASEGSRDFTVSESTQENPHGRNFTNPATPRPWRAGR